MRTPDVVAAELADLDRVLATFAPAVVDDYAGVAAMHASLLDRRARLIEELGDAEMAALAVVLDGRNVVDDHEVDVSFLVDVLAPLQESIASIGQALLAQPTTRSSIPGTIREATALRLRGTFPGSFGLALEGPRPPETTLLDLLTAESDEHRPVFERAVALLLDLLNASSATLVDGAGDEDVLVVLARLGPRAHGHLRKLAGVIASSDASANLVLTRPHMEPKRAVLNRASAERLERILSTAETDERDVKVQGRLVGASLVRDNFELERSDGSIMRGRVSPGVSVEDFFGKTCLITLRVSRARSQVDGTEAEAYTLVAIQ